MNTKEKIILEIERTLPLNSGRDKLLKVSLACTKEEKEMVLHLIIWRPRSYAMVSYSCDYDHNHEHYLYGDHFKKPYKILCNSRMYEDSLDIINSYFNEDNNGKGLSFQIIEAKKIGSENGNFFYS